MSKKKTASGFGSTKALLNKIKNNSTKITFIAMYMLIGGYLLYNTQAATGNDLVVTDITLNPASPAAGENVTFSATIKNQGTTATPEGDTVSVAFELDGELISWNRSHDTSLAPGESVTLSANDGSSGSTWTAETGPHTLKAIADDNDVISNETNEGNNTRNYIFTIGNTGSLYLSPEEQSVNVDDNLVVEARLNPDTNVDGVEASITYDSQKLQFVSLDTSDSPFDVKLSESTSSGEISLARGNLSGGVSDDSLVAEITFKARTGSGSGTIQIDGNASSSGVYTNPDTEDASVTFLTPDTTVPSVSITSPLDGDTVFGQKTVTVNASDNVGVTQVEIYVDGNLKATLDSTPYEYTLDTETLSNGEHILTAKAYDEAGNSNTSSMIDFQVNNLAEDINQDGAVNLLDFSLLATKYGQSGSNLGREDINGDNTVNLLDFSLLASKFGQ